MATKRASSLLVLAALAAALLTAVLAAPAGAAIRHLDGTVVSKSAKDHSFKLSTQSGTLRIRVDSSAVFERISGFGALRSGLAVEVDAKQTSKGLLAKRIETQGGGGGDGPNHT